MSIRVILADDHPVVREGLRYAIERTGRETIQVVGEAANGAEVLDLSRKYSADVYILDDVMPRLNGIDTAQKLIEENPDCKVIILSIYDSRVLVEKAFRLGARGYILKESATDELIKAILEVNQGRFFLSPAITRYIVDGFIGKMSYQVGAGRDAKLTRRETEVLQLIADGHTSREIATELNLYLNTVLVYRRKIMRKLDVHNQAELVRYAIKEGISKL
jgi:two-component system NarL family response regulator